MEQPRTNLQELMETPMKDRVATLVIDRPGRLRDALNAVLMGMPRIQSIENVDDGAAALRAFNGSRPALMVVDTSLCGDEAGVPLRQIKAKWRQTPCIAMAPDTGQQRSALSDGADVALLRGFSTRELSLAVERLLGHKRELKR